MLKIGFIDFYLDEWHANNYPKWIKEESKGEMEVTYAYGLVDAPNGRRTTAQWCSDMGITRCMSMEELIEKSDRLIVLSPDNCEMHECLCQLPLRSGKPTYIDKTFAPDYDIAKRIFDVADQFGTPCYTTSSLRYSTEYVDIKDVQAIASWGPGNLETYSIHQLEPIMMLMQADVARVLYTGQSNWFTLTMEFVDGRHATLTSYAEGSPFMMNLYTKEGCKVVTAESNSWPTFTKVLVNFFKTATVPVAHEETLRIMKARTAAMIAEKHPGQWVEA